MCFPSLGKHRLTGKHIGPKSLILFGGGGRTRTCEVVRRLIYSQLPLPLGTLPRPNSVSNSSARGGGGQNHRYGAEPARPGDGARSGAFMGKRTRKVNQGKRAKPTRNGVEIARTRNP